MAPSRLEPSIFSSMPPILPTLPSLSMVPVPAMVLPPLSLAGVSLSMRPSVYIMPADGPPMLSTCIVTLACCNALASMPSSSAWALAYARPTALAESWEPAMSCSTFF